MPFICNAPSLSDVFWLLSRNLKYWLPSQGMSAPQHEFDSPWISLTTSTWTMTRTVLCWCSKVRSLPASSSSLAGADPLGHAGQPPHTRPLLSPTGLPPPLPPSLPTIHALAPTLDPQTLDPYKSSPTLLWNLPRPCPLTLGFASFPTISPRTSDPYQQVSLAPMLSFLRRHNTFISVVCLCMIRCSVHCTSLLHRTSCHLWSSSLG